MNKLLIGPSGADEEFYNRGYKNTYEMPKYISELGLDCFEYPCGRGIKLSVEARAVIKAAFNQAGYAISLHAPYFINFANPDPVKIKNTFDYLYNSCLCCADIGGNRIVFHPGSYLKQTQEHAYILTIQNLNGFLDLYGDYLTNNNLYICPETMGKSSQVGTVEEVAKFASIHPNILPCVDFGHVNARYQGCLKTYDDFKQIIDTLAKYNDDFKVKNMHIHFSKIEYGQKGEIRHLTNDDTIFGPEFEPLAKVIADYGLTPFMVSESAGTQGKDAQFMKKVCLQALNS